MDERCMVCNNELKKGQRIVAYSIIDEEDMAVVGFQVHVECDIKKEYFMDREIGTV